jgi:LmbE family N-acetylglucosaminyl deacetylase
MEWAASRLLRQEVGVRNRHRERVAGALLLVIGLLSSGTAASGDALPCAGERRLALEKLEVLGSVLYIGAHPDDENTAMLAYLAKGRKLRTAYLSLTRGDGGQNLIGTEQSEALGVIRTQELLAARRVDGAEQYFTRAVDFGYSKTPEETLRIWGHDEVLADIVWVIRSFRPDVIISRFPENGDGGHGHHTASAILAHEAFVAAADPARFPEQLATVAPWQAKRLLWNAWRRPDAPASTPVTPGRLVVDLGSYDPLLGQAYTELAATARSFHKSQGFGSAPRRGPMPNELELVAGSPATTDLMEGVDTSWRRIGGGEAVLAALEKALQSYTDHAPERAVPSLVAAFAALDRLGTEPWITVKRKDLLKAIQECTGLWLEALATEPTTTPGAALKLTATAINRSSEPLRLVGIAPPFGAQATAAPVELPLNQPVTRELAVTVPAETPYTQPFWLEHGRHGGLDRVDDRRLVGLPEAPPPVQVGFTVAVEGRELTFEVPAESRTVDPVNGERSRFVAVVPELTVNFETPVVLFPEAAPRQIRLEATSYRSGLVTSLALKGPAGFAVTPETVEVRCEKAGEQRAITFTITPPKAETAGELSLELLTPRAEPARSALLIDHPHIPPQLLLPRAAVKVVRLDASSPVRRVGYIPGAGDGVASVLRQLGIEVVELDATALASADLARFDALVTGVRAYNTRPDLAAVQPRLLDYVQAGGTLVVQYCNDRGIVTDRMGPAPFKVTRDRVTDENAAVHFLLPAEQVLNWPNKLSQKDFVDWVQERGLYFASDWDQAYAAPLGMADPGEKETAGALLVTRSGKGAFVYTGLAFFRQLPAGNPSAIRLFLNILGAGRHRV